MMQKDTILILTDDLGSMKVRGALSGVEGALRRFAEINVDEAAQNMRDTLDNVLRLFSGLEEGKSGFAIESIRFTLVIAADGGISLASLAHAGLKTETGIEIMIQRKHTTLSENTSP
ncbi:MAG: hypothetical protein K0M40_03855 [Prolixibacteraceae bacterium]|nr:hypothetical protein [Prolixibacteraceae bacterium]